MGSPSAKSLDWVTKIAYRAEIPIRPCLFANLPTTITAVNTIDFASSIESQNDHFTSFKFTLHNEPNMMAGNAKVPIKTLIPLVCCLATIVL